MATHTLAPEMLVSLQESAREVLETMCSTTPTAIENTEDTQSLFDEEVVGLLGFTGSRCGSFIIRTTEEIAKSIAARMLMMDPMEFDDFAEAADAFGELVNMVCGSFKNFWVAQGNQMDLSVPYVCHKGSIRLSGESPNTVRSCVRVVLPEGNLDIGIHFEVA